MSDFGDDTVDYFDDGIDDDFLIGTPAVNGTTSATDTRRRAKRRRLGVGDTSLDADSDSFIENDDYSNDNDDEVPSPDRASFGADFYDDGEARPKNKSFVSKRSNMQDNIFVTQLTQPPSPPEMIRGPRWKKPDPEPEPTVSDAGAGRGAGQYYDDEKGIEAAIAASLRSFNEENSRIPTSKDVVERSAVVSSMTQKDSSTDELFDLEGIPDDAFDSDLSLSPPPRTNHPTATRAPVQTQFSTNRPLGLRQSSLFDMVPRSLGSSSQRGEQALGPPEKSEPPTHHKLDQEAIATWVYPTNLGKTRDYQFNIAQRGLFHNLLVALPTGLGKTFIAATVMLNWFRWTTNAQIIFVAPTKPLVAQQVSACFKVAGIPRSLTTMLTGEAAPGIRAQEWQTKRVFFMTPQTLINDLKTGIADPKRIVLLVVDEAHRATGGYAYVEVVKFLKRFNKSFRVLALTATPGSTVEAVQAVIDGLDIAKVEIRTEHSIDIREYVHSKNIEVQTFQNSDEMVLCMDLFSKTLQPLVDQLRNLNAYWGKDPMALTAFGLTKARQQWMGSDAGRNANLGLKGKVNTIFTVLASLAHAIDLLKYHGITPFYRHLVHFQSNTDGQKGGKYQRQVVQDDSFKKLMNHLQPWTKNPEFIGHPKLEYLKQVVLNHFMDAGEGSGEEQSESTTRVMIFVHFRDSAEEVARVLKRHEPLIRPHVFVGQSSAKGSDGMDQKTQLSIVQKFKKGTYNTIVATSIGEEGLDIGEVDLIVCYDSSASPIRMLQRMGRTGRKRAGNVVLLLMQGKEEESYIKAKDNYEKMQQMIASGSRFDFHDDSSPRILPPGVRPVADKQQIEIPIENTQQDLPEPKRRAARAPKKPPKKFHMPDDVETGFTKASSLEGSKTRKKAEVPKNTRKPTPEPVELPALEDVLLTQAQQRELELHYCNIGGTSPQFIRYPRTDAFPHLQLVSRPTKAVKHGSLTRRMIDTLQKMDKVSADCDSRYKEVLALEPNGGEDLVASSRSSHRELSSRQSKPNSSVSKRLSTTSHPNYLSVEKGNEGLDDDILETITAEQLLSSAGGRQVPKPFYSSQMTENEDFDNDLDLPDINSLLNLSAERKAPRKRNRFVLGDDSD